MNTENYRKIRVNGIDLAVRDQGVGNPVLIFLHYWGGSSRTWQMVIGDLASHYRCISYDHRGWGESDSPPGGYGLAELAADAEELIREGKVQVLSDGKQGTVGPGSVIFTASGVLHSLKNVGDVMAKYFVVAVGIQKAIV